jgi:hypothetical protein
MGFLLSDSGETLFIKELSLKLILTPMLSSLPAGVNKMQSHRDARTPTALNCEFRAVSKSNRSEV